MRPHSSRSPDHRYILKAAIRFRGVSGQIVESRLVTGAI